MSFVAISGLGGSLTVDFPPIVMSRHKEGGPKVGDAISIVNTPVVTEWDVAQDQAMIRLKFKVLNASQLASLESLLSAGGPIAITLTPGGGSLDGVFADRSKHRFTPYNSPYPNSDESGGSLSDTLVNTEAEVLIFLIP